MSIETGVDEPVDALSAFSGWLVHLRSGVGSALLKRMARADTDAFGEFYDLTAARVLGTVLAIIPQPELAEELTGEIFLEFWKTAPQHADEFEPFRSIVLFARYRAEQRRSLR